MFRTADGSRTVDEKMPQKVSSSFKHSIDLTATL